jgi:transketolase C-terminal domain/subunit
MQLMLHSLVSAVGYHTVPAGATHQAIEDVALMRSLPSSESVALEILLNRTPYSVQPKHAGPMYVRLGKIMNRAFHLEPMRLNLAVLLYYAVVRNSQYWRWKHARNYK